MRGILMDERIFSECFLLELFVFWLGIIHVNETGISALRICTITYTRMPHKLTRYQLIR